MAMYMQSLIEAPDTDLEPSLAWWQAFLRGRRPVSVTKGHNREVKVVDLFSGCGGLGLGVLEGLTAAGFKPSVEIAVDVDGEGLEVYKHNLNPNRIIHGSVATLVDFQVFGQGTSAEFAFPPEYLMLKWPLTRGRLT